jgi:bisphosphoglycerate-dependent phosphoglycerate mutase
MYIRTFPHLPDTPYSLLVAHTNTLHALVMHIHDIAINDVEVL